MFASHEIDQFFLLFPLQIFLARVTLWSRKQINIISSLSTEVEIGPGAICMAGVSHATYTATYLIKLWHSPRTNWLIWSDRKRQSRLEINSLPHLRLRPSMGKIPPRYHQFSTLPASWNHFAKVRKQWYTIIIQMGNSDRSSVEEAGY